MNPLQNIGTMYGNLFRLLADPDKRAQAIGLGLERGLVTFLGILITLVGVAFVLANSRAAAVVGDAVGNVAGLVITKGASKAGSVAKGIS